MLEAMYSKVVNAQMLLMALRKYNRNGKKRNVSYWLLFQISSASE